MKAAPRTSQPDTRSEAAHAALTAYLARRNMRRTPERFAILDAVLGLKGHFAPEQIMQALADRQFHVSRQTVYASLGLLTDCGLLKRHRFTGDGARFELLSDHSRPHHHLVCLQCGKVKELKDTAELPPLASRRFAGFTPEYYELLIYGVCSTCTRRAKKEASQANQISKNRSSLNKK